MFEEWRWSEIGIAEDAVRYTIGSKIEDEELSINVWR